MGRLGDSDDERRNLEYWYETHKKAARFFMKNRNQTSARQQLEAADRARDELEQFEQEASK